MTVAPCETSTSQHPPAASWAERVRRKAEDARLLLPALLAWAICAAALPLAWPLLGTIAAALLIAAGVLVRGRRRVATALALACGLTALTLGAAAGHTAAREAGPLRELAERHATVRIDAVLAGEPRVRPARNAGEGNDLVVVRVMAWSVRHGGAGHPVRTPVLVLADAAWADRHWRDRVRFTARLHPAEPGEDVAAVARASAPELLEAAPLPIRLAARLRDRLRQACHGLPPDAAGLVTGLSVGDTRLQPPGLADAMRETSLTHLSAVSGSNIALVVGAALLLSARLGLPRRARAPAAIIVLGAYVIVCGPEPSVLRAGVMGGVAVVGLARSRRRSSLPALGAAIVLLLAVDPWLARSAGFALSCLATLGLVVLARPWADAIGSRLPGRLRFVGEAVAVPVAAQVICAPVVVALTGRLPVVAFLANLAVAPLVAPVTVLGLITAVLSFLWAPLAHWCAWAAALPAQGIALVARRLADLPWASLPWPVGWPGLVLITVLCATLLVTGRWLAAWTGRHPVLVCAVVITLIAAVIPLPRGDWPPEGWAVVACDVGQGEAVVLSAGAAGHAVLVDAGPEDGRVLRCLDRLGVTTLDLLVLSHLHDDHAGAAAEVIRALPVKEVVVSPHPEPAALDRAVRAAAQQRGVPVRVARAGDVLRPEGLEMRVLAPERIRPGEAGINDASLVLSAEPRGVRVLLTGDLETQGARAALPAVRRDAGEHGPFQVLTVPHHGSRRQDQGLLRSSGAGLALISVGARNDFGHPAAATLTMLASLGLAVERTDEHGDLAVLVGGRIARLRP